MKNKKLTSLIVMISGVILGTLFGWFATDSLLLGSAFGIAILLAIIYLQKQAAKNNQFYHNIEASYNFVNLMNIQMLTTKSTYEAYEAIVDYLDIDFTNINSTDLINQLQIIADSYNITSFKMYINTFQIYENDGGDFKEMEQIPTALCQKTKVYYQKLRQEKFAKLVEITSLFLLFVAIVVFLKFSIPEYYAKMMENIVYQFVMLGILLAGGFMYFLSFKEYLKNKIRGM